MSDRRLRELERQASLGDPEAIERLRFYRAKAGLDLPRVLPAPAEPFGWANTVSGWVQETFDGEGSWRLSFEAGVSVVVTDASQDTAIEVAAGWLADNAPGLLTEPEYPLAEDGSESGWLGWDWYITGIDTTRAIVSQLSRALFGDEIPAPPNRPVIVYGKFWNAITYEKGVRNLYYPNNWTEEEVRDAAEEVDSSVKWHISEFEGDLEDGLILACWVEPGDDPLGADAEDYATAWQEADPPYRGDDDKSRWLAAARMLLWDVTQYMEREY